MAELAEGVLSEAERSELEAHVGACGPCAGMLAELAKLVAPSANAELGARIGRYELAEPLGSGGMGVVVEAFDPVLSRRVAIKIVRPDRQISRDRMLAEARALAQLSDPHVLTIHDVVDSERGICLVTELVDGDTAETWCLRARPAWPEIRALYLQIARGLAVVHARGLLHRDIKPANVLVGRDGRARLGDFGLVGDGAAPLGGTRGFMPPEQASGASIDVRADQFALAMSMIHAVAGAVVPAGTGALDLPAALPPPDRQALARAISVDPADRFDRIADLASALEAQVARRRWPIVAAGVMGAAVVVAIALAAAPTRRSPEAAVASAPAPRSDGLGSAAPAASPVALPAAAAAPPAPTRTPAPVATKPAVKIAVRTGQPTQAGEAPRAPPPDLDELEAAMTAAMSANDARGCAETLAKLVVLDPSYDKQRPLCEMLAGHCKAAVAVLQPRLGAATAGLVNDYCPADGDVPEHRTTRAFNQNSRGRSLPACKHRATWVTTLATDPEEAQQFAANAVECFAAIGACEEALAEAGVLAKLRSTTAASELARVAPNCDR